MKFYAIRGATTALTNSSSDIELASVELISSILTKNKLDKSNLVSLIASVTADIKAANPVKFIRSSGLVADTPVFCVQEASIDNDIKLCIRVLLHVQTDCDFTPTHIYLNGAKVLRPDLVN